MSVKKSLAWMGTAQVAVFGIQFTASIVLARLLTPHEFGVFSVGLAISLILAQLQNLGLQALIVREVDIRPAMLSTAFTINAALAVCLSLITVGASFVGAAFLKDAGIRDVLLVLSVSPLFGIFSFLPAAHLEREGRFREISFIILAQNCVSAGSTIVFAYLGSRYMSQAYAGVLSAATLAILFVVVGRRHLSLRVGLTEWRYVTHFGLQMLAVSGVTTLTQKASDIVLGRIQSLAALGMYNRAAGLNWMVWGNIHSLASRIVLVDFAQRQREGVSLRERYLETADFTTAILWPAFAGLAVVATPLITVVYGEKWVGAALPLMLLAVASIILTAITMTWEVFTVTGEIGLQTRVETIRAPIGLVLFTAACFIGLEAAAFSRILDAAIAYGLYRPHLNRLTATNFSDLRPIYLRSFALTLTAITPGLVLQGSIGSEATNSERLASSVGLGALCWVIGIFLMHHPIAREIKRSVVNLWNRNKHFGN